MTGLHPPKVETFNLRTSVNTDPKGFPRPVDRWELGHRGDDPGSSTLYMARPADHPRFGYLESWLLPRLDLRVNRFHFRNGTGHGRYPDQQLYIDIALVEPTGPTGELWRTTDLYIDVVTYAGGQWEILDLDELADAMSAGHLEPPLVHQALRSAQRLVDGMSASGSVEHFLISCGYPLTWAAPDTIALAPAGAEPTPQQQRWRHGS